MRGAQQNALCPGGIAALQLQPKPSGHPGPRRGRGGHEGCLRPSELFHPDRGSVLRNTSSLGQEFSRTRLEHVCVITRIKALFNPFNPPAVPSRCAAGGSSTELSPPMAGGRGQAGPCPATGQTGQQRGHRHCPLQEGAEPGRRGCGGHRGEAPGGERKQMEPARHPGLPSKSFSINTKGIAPASNNNHGSEAFIGTEIGFSITAAQRPVFNKQQNQTQQLCVWGSPDAPRGQQHPCPSFQLKPGLLGT